MMCQGLIVSSSISDNITNQINVLLLNDLFYVYQIIKSETFLDYITENYSKYGCDLCIVTDKSIEGNQLIKGFGGIGGILRWKYEMDQYYGSFGAD